MKSYFFELEDKTVASWFSPKVAHQSYPGRLHGGISISLLDEIMARAVMPYHSGEDILGITLGITAKFRKPIELNQQAHMFYSKVVSNTSRFFRVFSKIVLPDKQVAVEATGIYMKVSLRKVIQDKAKTINNASIRDHTGWKVYKDKNDPKFFEVNNS